MDADDWLRDIEGKLNLCRCNDEEKVAFAAYYLQGAAAAWWESYKSVLPQGVPVTWNVFKEAFRTAHIPEGITEIKRKEFRNLQQNNMSFMDFLNKFNYLSGYVPEEMTTEARKVNLCQERLNPEIKHQLSAHDIPTMKSLVDKALRIEESAKEVIADRKRKWVAQKSASSGSSRPRTWQPTGARRSAPSPARPQVQVPRPRQAAVQPYNRMAQPSGAQNQAANIECFNCGLFGHYSNKCPYPKKMAPPPQAQVAQQQPRGPVRDRMVQQGGQTGPKPGQGFGCGHLNQATAKEADNAPDVVLGTFIVHSAPTLVLFDSGASHSFISTRFAEPQNLRAHLLDKAMLIQSPGSTIKTERICLGVGIVINGVEFKADLIQINSLGLDIILGMD